MTRVTGVSPESVCQSHHQYTYQQDLAISAIQQGLNAYLVIDIEILVKGKLTLVMRIQTLVMGRQTPVIRTINLLICIETLMMVR